MTSTTVMTPLLVSAFVVVTAYLMKKDEKDPSKTPNYLVLFLASLIVVWVAMTLIGSGDSGEAISNVMQEIDVGEPPF